jgi:hypothetical protein
MSDTEIKLGVGFSEVKFGMNEKEVVELLGQPDETEEMRFEDDGLAIIYYYDELGISLSFESEEDYRLMEISFEDEDFNIKGLLQVGVNKIALPEIFKKLGLSEPHHEDLESEGFPGKEIYTFEDENLNIWLDEEEVSSIQIGPLWEDDDNISWPN